MAGVERDGASEEADDGASVLIGEDLGVGQSCAVIDLDSVRDAVRGTPYEGFLLIGPFDIYRHPDLIGKIRNDFAGIPLSARLEFGGLDLIAPLALGAASSVTTEWAEANSYQLMTIRP